MTSKMQRIDEAWLAFEQNGGALAHPGGPMGALETTAREAELELAKAIEEPIEQYMEGLISASELVKKLYLAAYSPE